MLGWLRFRERLANPSQPCELAGVGIIGIYACGPRSPWFVAETPLMRRTCPLINRDLLRLRTQRSAGLAAFFHHKRRELPETTREEYRREYRRKRVSQSVTILTIGHWVILISRTKMDVREIRKIVDFHYWDYDRSVNIFVLFFYSFTVDISEETLWMLKLVKPSVNV